VASIENGIASWCTTFITKAPMKEQSVERASRIDKQNAGFPRKTIQRKKRKSQNKR
jgi:hypothetical protein